RPVQSWPPHVGAIAARRSRPPLPAGPVTMSCPPAALERRATSSLVLLWLLTGYIALQPLSTDFYLPALPGMASSFGTSVAMVQLTLTLYIAVFGIAQLFVGPLAD